MVRSAPPPTSSLAGEGGRPLPPLLRAARMAEQWLTGGIVACPTALQALFAALALFIRPATARIAPRRAPPEQAGRAPLANAIGWGGEDAPRDRVRALGDAAG